MNFVMPGTVATFPAAAFSEGLAATVGVPTSSITLTITGAGADQAPGGGLRRLEGSSAGRRLQIDGVNVNTVIAVPKGAADVLSKVSAVASNPTALSEAVGQLVSDAHLPICPSYTHPSTHGLRKGDGHRQLSNA